MFDGLGLGNIFGVTPAVGQGAQGIANGYNPYAQQNGHWAQGAAAQQHLMSIHARNNQPLPRWIFNGQPMDFDEFVEAVFPEDCPQKTFFVLKYKK